jgi:DNA/RNA-binding domain of Phe-tRNA-synthetase-like protein
VPRSRAEQPLVEAMFMAELKNLILTAGHDLAAISPPVRIDVSRDDDRYVLMNGSEQALRAGDMTMVDGEGLVSTVVYGPDRRTRITPENRFRPKPPRRHSRQRPAGGPRGGDRTAGDAGGA